MHPKHDVYLKFSTIFLVDLESLAHTILCIGAGVDGVASRLRTISLVFSEKFLPNSILRGSNKQLTVTPYFWTNN